MKVLITVKHVSAFMIISRLGTSDNIKITFFIWKNGQISCTALYLLYITQHCAVTHLTFCPEGNPIACSYLLLFKSKYSIIHYYTTIVMEIILFLDVLQSKTND